jgi:hypothetical protein
VAWWNGSGGPGRTGAGLLLGELVDEHGDADGMGGLGRDKEVVVVVDDEADEHERGHAGDDGEEGLDLGRLPAQPRQRRSHGPPRAPHLVPLAFRTPPLSIGQGESRLVSLSLSLSLSLWFPPGSAVCLLCLAVTTERGRVGVSVSISWH